MNIPIYEQRTILRFKTDKDYLLKSDRYIYEFLNCRCKTLGFHIILGPFIKVYEDPTNPEKCGVTGIVAFSESSMSIHTWPEYGYAAIDLYSCKTFDNEDLVRAIKWDFKASEYNLTSL